METIFKVWSRSDNESAPSTKGAKIKSMNHTIHSDFQFIERDPFEKVIARRSSSTKKSHQPMILLAMMIIAYLPVVFLCALEGTLYKDAGMTFIGDFGAQFR